MNQFLAVFLGNFACTFYFLLEFIGHEVVNVMIVHTNEKRYRIYISVLDVHLVIHPGGTEFVESLEGSDLTGQVVE